MLMFSIYDSKVGVYAPPFAVAHRVLAIRAFIDVASDEASQISKHPADFNLMFLGTFKPDTGGFDALPAPENLGTAASFVAKPGGV